MGPYDEWILNFLIVNFEKTVIKYSEITKFDPTSTPSQPPNILKF